jgi:hypothetical protein
MALIECPICPVIVQRTKNYITDLQYIFKPEFISKNYHKHLLYSYILTIPTMLILLQWFHLADTGLFFQSFVGTFGAGAVNFVREWYYGKYHGAPYDGVDVNMGSYGGLLGALTAVLIFTKYLI